MDLFRWDCSCVGGIARPDVVGVDYRFCAPPYKTGFGNSRKFFLRDPIVGSIVTDDLSRDSGCVGGIARPDVVRVSTDSAILHVKHPPETPEKTFRAIQRPDL